MSQPSGGTCQLSRISQGQFEGCLLGVLVGDSLGLPYENESSHHVGSSEIQAYFNDLHKSEKETKCLKYSDDSSMTKTLAEFLIEIKPEAYDPRQLAKKFTEAYNNEQKGRGYSTNVPKVFKSLAQSKYSDPFKPAQGQFRGQGSFGNGAAMRVSPLALMTTVTSSAVTKPKEAEGGGGTTGGKIIENFPPIPDFANLVHLTIATSRLTHGHPLGIMGGIFHALALRQCLIYGVERERSSLAGKVGPSTTTTGAGGGLTNGDKNGDHYWNRDMPMRIFRAFRKDLRQISLQQFPFVGSKRIALYALKIYENKLRNIRKLLSEGNATLSVDRVKNLLGVKRAAVDSVPTSFFCFLASFQDIPFIETTNQFQRTIQLAVACGGDTDTIGSMAGSLAGSYLGRDFLDSNLIRHCEDHEKFLELAHTLFEKRQKMNENKDQFELLKEYQMSWHRDQKWCTIS